jgi:putative ABC transport system permease protein
MALIFTLAARNLLQDRLRFIATVVGIVFSIVLVSIQLGLYLGFSRVVTVMIDHARADLWVMPVGTKCFEDPSLLDERERFRALSVSGVAQAIPVVIGFAQWHMPSGETTPVFMIGSDIRAGGLLPWNLVAGNIEDLQVPGAVAVDRSYLGRLGISGIGVSAEINDRKVEVRALTDGIRYFTTTPYVFTLLDRVRSYTRTAPTKATYFLVRATLGTDIEGLRNRLKADIPDVEVLTPSEFRDRSRSFWLFGTGAGAALLAGALLGLIVGTVIVAQTLYSSTKDHLNEFATLRAIGSSGLYIHAVIVCQALVSAIVGFCIAMGVALLVVRETTGGALPIIMTPTLSLAILTLTVVMCVLSALAAIAQVMRIDPVMVFTR